VPRSGTRIPGISPAGSSTQPMPENGTWLGAPGGGSVFFLHVTENKPTQGCVSIPAGTLVSIMRWGRPGTVIALC
jgi:hypothetical protein